MPEAQLLTLVVYPDKLLRTVSEEIDVEDDRRWEDCQHLIACMIKTMRTVGGLGLSAIQVAVPWRVVVVETADPEKPLVMINPEIIAVSDEDTILQEGCLSFPGIFAGISRPEAAIVGYYNQNREYVKLEVETLVARCIQHEIDHLNGKVFMDYLKPVARDVVTRKMKKFKKKLKIESEKMRYAARLQQEQRDIASRVAEGTIPDTESKVQSSASLISSDGAVDSGSAPSVSSAVVDSGERTTPSTDT